MATIQARIKQLTRKTKAELVELIVDDEPEVVVVEDSLATDVVDGETATGETSVALVTTKDDPRAPLLEAVRIDPYPVDADEPNGAQYEYRVGDQDYTESEFYRIYSPFDHNDAKILRQEG